VSDLHGTNNHCFRHGYAVGIKRGAKLATEYRIWLKVRERCISTTCKQYPDYGGRGIRICDRWLGKGGFKNFLEDMGPRPSKAYSLDRRDNDGPYSPENCRWATRVQQNRNSRHNVNVTFDGVTRCINEWAEYFGLKTQTFRARIERVGIEEAMRLGGRHGGRGGVSIRRTTRYLELSGRRMCVSEWARETGIPRTCITARLKKGWSVESTLTTPVRGR
jgi:hypothetical protein